MAKLNSGIIAMTAPVTIAAADAEKKGPRKFSSTFYTGGSLDVEGYDRPVVIDLAGLKEGNVLVANLDHERSKRVGNFQVSNDGKMLTASGLASAATPARDEVVASADDGYQWQSSIEAKPHRMEPINKGDSVTVNGQKFDGPLYVARSATLKGFAFVSHGADDNTSVIVAASAASKKGTDMDAALKTWIEGMLPGVNADDLDADSVANLKANFDGKNGKKVQPSDGGTASERRKIEAKRRTDINALADDWMGKREGDLEWITAIEEIRDEAIEAKKSIQDFRNDLYESILPMAHTVSAPRRDKQLAATSDRILIAAVCQSGRLCDDKSLVTEHGFTDQELQAAHDQFKSRISLKELFATAAQRNGYIGSGFDITLDVQRAAFGMVRGSIGFSGNSIANVVSNVANKFLRQGWMAVDLTPLRIAAIRAVRDFKQITTVSLTGHLQFEQVGPAGELKHGTLGDLTYNNQAYTYGALLAITRTDYINDDLNALTQAPMRMGRGGALKLNDIFWTAFLNNSSFFTSGNGNTSTGGGSALGTADGAAINAAEVKFINQTDPDGKPLGIMPSIMLVPPTLKNTAARWMGSQLFTPSGTTGLGATNIFGGRYTIESSPYMENSSYTGNSTAAWYLLANPSDLPVIEIVALNGRVEPTVESSDADFNTLGTLLRGYSDIGVALQEYRGGVRSAGS